MAIIYCITAPSGKQYVGQTTGTLQRRWKAHVTSQDCPLISRAIQKYGEANMKLSILEEDCPTEELDDKECHYIKTLGTLSPGGYNLCTGGHSNRSWSLETREKIKSRLLGRECSEATRQKLSVAMMGRIMTPEHLEKIRCGRIGKVHSEESKQKMREAKLGKSLPRRNAGNNGLPPYVMLVTAKGAEGYRVHHPNGQCQFTRKDMSVIAKLEAAFAFLKTCQAGDAPCTQAGAR